MSQDSLKCFYEKLIPKNYLTIAYDSQNTKIKLIKNLLEHRKLPDNGWNDLIIEKFINDLSSMDSNNFLKKSGIGEREGRIICDLVAKRHYNFGHGIGRSGDLMEAQPKAAGSSIMSQLVNCLLLDLIQTMGVLSAKKCLLVPMATGMTLTLCFLSLKAKRPAEAKYILWSRIDQKSCFKSILTAGYTPIIIDTIYCGNELTTDITEFEKQIKILGSNNILCIFSTTSCFAPRACDNINDLSILSKLHDIPHVVNNAYGLQSTYYTHQIEQANRVGRIDMFVQSTDKNLLVPVGGAIVASSFDCGVIDNLSNTYAGRASASQTLDVLMTLLSLGKSGYLDLVQKRKKYALHLTESLTKLASKYNEEVFLTKHNRISVAISLKNFDEKNLTEIGSMLFTRGISGVRVVTTNTEKNISKYCFKGWGGHTQVIQSPYLTAAAGLGITEDDINIFIQKLDQVLDKHKKKTESG